MRKLLAVRVAGGKSDTHDSLVVHVVDSVATASADTDYLNYSLGLVLCKPEVYQIVVLCPLAHVSARFRNSIAKILKIIVKT